MSLNKASKTGCYNCKDRRVEPGYNCHSNCERYAEFKEYLEKTKAEAKERRDNWIMGYRRRKSWRRQHEQV